MRIINDEIINDDEGKKRIVTYENGTKSEALIEPSQSWKDTHQDNSPYIPPKTFDEFIEEKVQSVLEAKGLITK